LAGTLERQTDSPLVSLVMNHSLLDFLFSVFSIVSIVTFLFNLPLSWFRYETNIVDLALQNILPLNHPNVTTIRIGGCWVMILCYGVFFFYPMVSSIRTVLYIPSHWFHYIVSLQKSAQCNVRSGIDTDGSKYFGGKDDVEECTD
jgi:hypothetical protein